MPTSRKALWLIKKISCISKFIFTKITKCKFTLLFSVNNTFVDLERVAYYVRVYMRILLIRNKSDLHMAIYTHTYAHVIYTCIRVPMLLSKIRFSQHACKRRLELLVCLIKNCLYFPMYLLLHRQRWRVFTWIHAGYIRTHTLLANVTFLLFYFCKISAPFLFYYILANQQR